MKSFILFTADCLDDIDCPSSKACIDNTCIDPCSFSGNKCPSSSQCYVKNHKIDCQCPSGTRGNPLKQCIPVECAHSSDCPRDFVCDKGRCKDLCKEHQCGNKGICSIFNDKSVCECPIGHKGNASMLCTPLISACFGDEECPVGLACIQGECTDPCSKSRSCALNALCAVIDSRPVKSISCTCPPGFSGNAEVQCRKSMIS